MKSSFALIFLAAVALGLGALLLQGDQPSEEILIVQNGQPLAAIIIDPGSGEAVRKAAQTLQHYLEASTGARLPIRTDVGREPGIHVGMTAFVKASQPDFSGIDEEGYILRGFRGKHFMIAGPSDWGTEFGVYAFLERYLGIRWLMPGEFGEDVPLRSSLLLPLAEVRDTPVYLSRQFSGLNDAGPEWALRNRIRIGRLERRHNLNGLFPPSRFAKTHPEYYPLLDGKRYIPKSDTDYHWQPDFSHPGIVDAAVKEINTYFAGNPTASSYSLSTNDTGNFDESPRSAARRTGKINSLGYLDVSNDYFTWANSVVEEVLKTHPDKWFGAYAYMQTLDPPTSPATLSEKLVPHITYERLLWGNPKLKQADQELTRRWAAVAPTLGWYDYVYGSAYLVPRVWFRLSAEYLRWGAEHNVRFFHGDYGPNWAGEGPKTWLFARLLWNPQADVDELLDEWYRSAAGKAAAPKLREYYSIWEKFWTEEIFKTDWIAREGEDGALYMPFFDPDYLLSIPPAYLERSATLLEEAEALADTAIRKKRVEKIRKMGMFYLTSAEAYQAEVAATATPLETEEAVLKHLEQAGKAIETGQKRLQLLRSFRPDEVNFPFYRPLLCGVNWGQSQIWRAFPWINKSSVVKQQVEALSREGSAAVRKSAALLLRATDPAASPRPLLTNSSFEKGLEGWNPNIHRSSEGEIRASRENAIHGEGSLTVEGVKRGLISRNFPCPPGDHYVTISAYLPEGSELGTVSIRLLSPTASRNTPEFARYSLALPAQKIALEPGRWQTLAMPFTSPSKKTEQLTVRIDIADFAPGAKVFLDSVNVYELGPVKVNGK